MELLSAVLERIRPTAEETSHINAVADKLKSELEYYIESNDLDISVLFVGSVAKGTQLNDPDLDVFLLFPEDSPRTEMESTGLRIGEEVLHGQRRYAEHPYTRGMYEGIKVDLVPCFHIKTTEKILSAVDRTPFHLEYVKSHSDEAMRDQIRLTKRFMKGIGTYGAEPNTRGFSGYMCELLTIHYGGFMELLTAASSWNGGMVINPGKKNAPMISPLVLYDPVDPKRNVASAVHIETLAEFIVACKAFLRNPSERFFFPATREPMSDTQLAAKTVEHGSRLVTVLFDRPEINEDNLHSQLWKTQYALEKKLDSHSFNVLRAVHKLDEDSLVIVFEVERDMLSKTRKHVGPAVWVSNSESFLSKWKGNEYGDPFIEDGHWTVIADRMYLSAVEMLADETAIAGIGREIEPSTMEILDHNRTLAETDPSLLTELLEPKMSWEI